MKRSSTSQNAAKLEAYCQVLETDSSIELREENIDEPYLIELHADRGPLVVCSPENYLDAIRIKGRRADYMIVGFAPEGEPLILFVELRRELITLKHTEDKCAQIEETVRAFCKETSNLGVQHHENPGEIFKQACDNLQGHLVAGAIIPVFLGRARARQSLNIKIGEKQIVISPIILEGRGVNHLSWSNLLVALGFRENL